MTRRWPPWESLSTRSDNRVVPQRRVGLSATNEADDDTVLEEGL